MEIGNKEFDSKGSNQSAIDSAASFQPLNFSEDQNATLLMLAAAQSTRLNSSLISLPVSGSPGLTPPSMGSDQGRQKLTGKLVQRAIDRGVRYLLGAKRNGEWTGSSHLENGGSALATLALLNSGVKGNDPRIRGTIEKLAKANPQDTYVVSLITMVLSIVDPVRYRNDIQKNVDWLERAQVASGGWAYKNNGRSADSSNSQFAILALHEAVRAGANVDLKTWKAAKLYWINVHSERKGSFRYKIGSRGSDSGSMTCAGISSLIIIEENLNLASSQLKNGEVACCGHTETNKRVEQGIQWISDKFLAGRNPGGVQAIKQFPFYYRYSVERAGRLSGQRFFGDHDWYREIAATLLHRTKGQKIDGSWGRRGGSENKVIATSMALLFLAKGLRPILASKYQYSEDRNWNRHPRGLHYLTRFTEKVWQTKLNWQSIDGRKANVNDLLETPVLLISGDGPMNLSKTQKARLKQYVDNGGFLFIEANLGNGCPNAKAFDREVRDMLGEWFPDSKLKVLSPEHPVWTAQFMVKPKQKFPLLGIESCCRTSVIYCAAPISGFWQLKTPSAKLIPDPAKTNVEYAAKLGVNILAFATGNILKDRLDRPKIDVDDKSSVLGRQMKIGKLRHNAGYNDAPASLGNLIRRSNIEKGLQFHNKFDITSGAMESLVEYPVLFVHGRGKIQFTKEQRDSLKKHIERGGFVFGDAICGNREFYESFKAEMLTVLEGVKWEKIGDGHPIFTQKYNGYTISEVERKTKGSKGKYQKFAPELDGIKVQDKYQVILSQHDISCALENGTSTTCYGYSHDDAARIGINICCMLCIHNRSDFVFGIRIGTNRLEECCESVLEILHRLVGLGIGFTTGDGPTI